MQTTENHSRSLQSNIKQGETPGPSRCGLIRDTGELGHPFEHNLFRWDALNPHLVTRANYKKTGKLQDVIVKNN